MIHFMECADCSIHHTIIFSKGSDLQTVILQPERLRTITGILCFHRILTPVHFCRYGPGHDIVPVPGTTAPGLRVSGSAREISRKMP
jgi:hypothetical protein